MSEEITAPQGENQEDVSAADNSAPATETVDNADDTAEVKEPVSDEQKEPPKEEPVNEDTENIWNIGVTQVNDLYLYVDKTIKDDEQTIKEIKIENFVINKAPNRGKIKVFCPKIM